MHELTVEQKRWIGSQLTKEERKAIIRVSYGGHKDIQFYIAEARINDLIKTMNTHPPQSIPADEFNPRFDTSTTAGKIAVYGHFLETRINPWVKRNDDLYDTWDQSIPSFDWDTFDYNFPAKSKRTLVPWDCEQVPVGALLRYKNNDKSVRMLIVCNMENGFTGTGSKWPFHELAKLCEHSLDGGKTWLPCGTWKEEV